MAENQPKVANPNDIVVSGRAGHDHEMPQEIIEEIALRLPAKSVVRFKSVSRRWFNMISDLDLPEVNFQQSISKLRLIYRIQNPPRRRRRCAHANYSHCSFKLDERGTKAKIEATLRLRQDVNDWSHPTYSSCDSLLLFQDYNYNLYVYDTITKQQKLLPEIPFDRTYGGISDFSMVYDSSKGNYKVVVFVEQYPRGIELFLYDVKPREVSREWWSEGQWRKSKPPFSQIILEGFSIVSILVQGVLYWIAEAPGLDHERDDYNCFIQPMEIAPEKFVERIEAPCQPVQMFTNYQVYQLIEMKGSLCLAHAAPEDELNIWVLQDSVQSFWIKQYNIALSSTVPPLSDYHIWNLRFVHLTAESHVLVTIFQEPYWFNLDTGELSKITVEEHPSCPVLCFLSIIKY